MPELRGWGEATVLEDWGEADATENKGDAREKAELDGVKGVADRVADKLHESPWRQLIMVVPEGWGSPVKP